MIIVTVDNNSISKDSSRTKTIWISSESYNNRHSLQVSSKVMLKRWLKKERVDKARREDIHPKILLTIQTAIARERRTTTTTLEILHQSNHLFQRNRTLVSTSFSTVLLQTSTNKNWTLMKMSLSSTLIERKTNMTMIKVKTKNNSAIRVQITLQMRKNVSV